MGSVLKYLLNQVSRTTCGFKPETDQMFHFISIIQQYEKHSDFSDI